MSVMALNGRGDTDQICPLLKVNRPCHLAAVTSQFDPTRDIDRVEIPQRSSLLP
jgi:hypothetical protein